MLYEVITPYIVDRHVDLSSFLLVEECADLQTSWLRIQDALPEIIEGNAGVHDVFDEEDVLVGNVLPEMVMNLDLPRCFGLQIA